MNEQQKQSLDYNRRDFLKCGSMATTMVAMLGGVELIAQTNATPGGDSKPPGFKVKVGVIGLGPWGREILNTLAQQPEAEVVGVCEKYPAFLNRGAKIVAGAEKYEDYTKLLENKDIQAVVIATPTHQHKEIVLAALNAGKHVYCEAPLAHTIEDARAIASAAKAAKTLMFQPGLQMRADPQRHFLLPFIRSGAIGRSVMARAQYHKKQSWRATSPNPEREKEINWRLDRDLSLGLVGEIGIHPIDQATWYFDSLPAAVTGFGSVVFWRDDGRNVPDTVQTVLEFPAGVNMIYDATLANSFDGQYEVLYGSDAAVMMRESNAWMFKEVDSPLLGWEVYAKKETFHKETGIMLKAGASKSSPTETQVEVPFTNTPLAFSLGNFLRNAFDYTVAKNDFIEMMGADDKEALNQHMTTVRLQPAASIEDGYRATVIAIKANEAVNKRQRVEIKPELYELT